jgi:hypothetical protein
MQAAARRATEHADRHADGQPLDSKPRALDIPSPLTEPDRITVLPNGDLQTRTPARHGDLVCTHSRPALDEAFSVWARHRPAKCTLKGNGTPTMAEELDKALKQRHPQRQVPGLVTEEELHAREEAGHGQ